MVLNHSLGMVAWPREESTPVRALWAARASSRSFFQEAGSLSYSWGKAAARALALMNSPRPSLASSALAMGSRQEEAALAAMACWTLRMDFMATSKSLQVFF